MARILAVAVAIALTVGACQGERSCGAPPQRYDLPRPFEEHACMHVAVGPFETVPAQASSDVSPPELRNTHVAYTVDLPIQDGAPAGRVMFKPRETAPFAFFLDSEAPLAFRSSSGDAICAVAVRPVAACAGLRRAVFYELERKVEYELEWNEGAPARVLVVVEPVTTAPAAP